MNKEHDSNCASVATVGSGILAMTSLFTINIRDEHTEYDSKAPMASHPRLSDAMARSKCVCGECVERKRQRDADSTRKTV